MARARAGSLVAARRSRYSAITSQARHEWHSTRSPSMASSTLLHELDNYRGFLVRLHRADGSAVWGAMAVNVQTRREYRFATLDALFDFLRAQTELPPEAARGSRALSHDL
jgi:hypothetical protein